MAQVGLSPTVGGGLMICSPKPEPKATCDDKEAEKPKNNCGIYDPNCDDELSFGASPPGRAGAFLSLLFNEDGSFCVNIGPHAGLPGPSIGLGDMSE